MIFITKLTFLRAIQVTTFFILELHVIEYLTHHLFKSLTEENALRTRYEALISTMEESLIVLDNNYKINFVSKSLMGYEPSYFYGKGIEDFEFLKKDSISRNIDSQEKSSWIWNEKGREYLFKASSIKKKEILIVCKDQTDLKKSKENEVKLIKAETSLKSKIEFIASISHEIRNPLQSASYSIENLEETNLDSDQTEFLHDIKSSNELASGIIGDILDMSKIEAGKMKINLGNVNIVELCERSIEHNFHQAKKKKLSLFLIFDPKIPKEFECDQIRLLQILNNFLSNSIKYSNKGTIYLNVEIKDKFLKFSVKDEGIGMSNETLTSIFTPFEQFEQDLVNQSNEKFQRKGWGLGLSICKKLVELLSGKIGVESEIEKGSIFWIELPLLKPSKQYYIQPKTLHYDQAIILHSNPIYQDFLYKVLKQIGIQAVFKKILKEKVEDDDEQILFVEDCLLTPTINEMENTKIVVLGDDNTQGTLKVPLKTDRFLRYLYPKSPSFKPFSKFSIFDEKKILLCEDNQVIHKSLLMLLKNAGMTAVSSAYNGEEGVNFYKKGMNFDIILMDIQMPKLNGIDAVKIIREHVRQIHGKQPIIFICSGNAFDSDICKLKKMWEVDEILTKPITKDNLLSTFDKY